MGRHPRGCLDPKPHIVHPAPQTWPPKSKIQSPKPKHKPLNPCTQGTVLEGSKVWRFGIC